MIEDDEIMPVEINTIEGEVQETGSITEVRTRYQYWQLFHTGDGDFVLVGPSYTWDNPPANYYMKNSWCVIHQYELEVLVDRNNLASNRAEDILNANTDELNVNSTSYEALRSGDHDTVSYLIDIYPVDDRDPPTGDGGINPYVIQDINFHDPETSEEANEYFVEMEIDVDTNFLGFGAGTINV